MNEPELNQDQTKRMIRLYKSGLSGLQVAKKMRSRYGFIWGKLWRLGLPQQRIARAAV